MIASFLGVQEERGNPCIFFDREEKRKGGHSRRRKKGKGKKKEREPFVEGRSSGRIIGFLLIQKRRRKKSSISS